MRARKAPSRTTYQKALIGRLFGPYQSFLLHVIFNAGHYHRFESFRQITVELHKKNSVERDKAFLFLEISFELSSQLEDHQDAYTR